MKEDAEGLQMSLAIAVLQERMEKLHHEYERDRRELEQAISNLKKLPRGVQLKDGIAIEEGGWEGMCLTDSIHSLLLRSHGPVQFEKVVKALHIAGVRLGDPTKPNRFGANVKTTIINNRDRFRYDKRRDTVELVKPVPIPQFV